MKRGKSELATVARRAWIGLVAIAGVLVCAAATAQWVPNETQVSPQADLIDYEFSQSRGLFAWNDQFGNLWVGSVDRTTGMFVPADGRGILVDPDSMTFQDAQKTKNGPEWFSSTNGDGIVYTKYAGAHSDNNSRIGLAQLGADGVWRGGYLGPDGAARKAPYGSMDKNDPAPRITYVDNKENHYWREVFNPATEQMITDFPPSNYPIRHVRGARAVAYPLTVDGVDQAFYRDLDSGVVTQLTFDAGIKYEIWMWQAPEFGNEFVFMTLVDQVEMRVYRYLPVGTTGTKAWTPIYSQVAPKGSNIFSPEPFVWNNKSYVFMSQSVRGNKFRSEIWISNIDAANPIFKRITDNSLLRTRTDPEVFITAAGPRIYYNRLTLDYSSGKPRACREIACSEGVWMADPGLLP